MIDAFDHEREDRDVIPVRRTSIARDKALAAVRRASLSDPGKGWAHRILDRHRRGERLSSLALDWAEEVTGESRDRMRETGEDDGAL